MKSILVLNSGKRHFTKDYVSEMGGLKLTFLEVWRIEDLQRVQGQVWDDIVWVERLKWVNPDREVIEHGIQMRVMRRNG